jgi:FixJ family two-component response regulator
MRCSDGVDRRHYRQVPSISSDLRRCKFKLVVLPQVRVPHETSMRTTRSLVSVVDDDESVRESLPDLLREFGFAVRAFSSAEEFLGSDCVEQTKCLILDIAMPGITGPELQQELKQRRQKIPIIFITAQRDETIRARVLGQGATECLFKPFSDTALSAAVNAALD